MGSRRACIILCATFAVGLSCAHAWNPATIVGPNDLKAQPFPLAVQVYQNGEFRIFTVIFGRHKETGNLPLYAKLHLWVGRQGGNGIENLGVVILRSEGRWPENARDTTGTNQVVVHFTLHRRMCIWPSSLSFVYQPLTLEGQRPHYTLSLHDFTGEPEVPVADGPARAAQDAESLVPRLQAKGVTQLNTSKIVLHGSEADEWANAMTTVTETLLIQEIWDAILQSRLETVWHASGYRRADFFTDADTAKPALMLWINASDACHIEGENERFHCPKLNEFVLNLLRRNREMRTGVPQ